MKVKEKEVDLVQLNKNWHICKKAGWFFSGFEVVKIPLGN